MATQVGFSYYTACSMDYGRAFIATQVATQQDDAFPVEKAIKFRFIT